MRKIKLDKYIDTNTDKIVSTGFKVKESILEDFRVAQKLFKETTNTSFKFREVLEDLLVDLTGQLNEATDQQMKDDVQESETRSNF